VPKLPLSMVAVASNTPSSISATDTRPYSLSGIHCSISRRQKLG